MWKDLKSALILLTYNKKKIDFRLSKDKSTTFGCTIENFIQCTLESQETNPHHVTRNVSQNSTIETGNVSMKI